jgi:NhaP-type Na+/H+ or K+/H+ antiporter
MFSRFLSIMLFYKIFKKKGQGFSYKDVMVLSYGGIRGAVGISFALII